MPSTTNANPLLLEWLKEIYDVAKERDSKGVTTYKRAYESMKACPLTFSHPSEAIQLDGIGPKICDRLTERLKEHCEANGLPPPKKPKGKARKVLDTEDLARGVESPPAKKQRRSKPYVPTLRTGPYAIIIALSSLPEDSLQSLTKAELIALAQPHSESSFTVPSEAGKFYTAWNSMKQLLDKDLVQERGRPLRKYALTDEGWEVARRMKKAAEIEDVGTAVMKKSKKKKADQGVFGQVVRTTQGDAGFIDLEGESALDEEPPEQLGHERPISKIGGRRSPSSGQRLGDKPTDKYSTFSRSKESSSNPESKRNPRSKHPSTVFKRNVIELLSSPEPQPQPEIPWASTSLAQDSRKLTSKTNTADRSEIRRSKPPIPTFESQTLSNLGAPSRSCSTTTPSLPTFEPIIIPPGTFTVHLVLDNREVRSKDDRDYLSEELTKRGIKPIVRSLGLGDFFWVAKLHSPTFLSQHGEEAGDEVALDWIVERKRLDDLVGSITDGRFQEQKFRLRRSGVKNVVYLIEEFSLSTEKSTKFHEAIQSAIASTQVVNGYFVKQTRKLDETISYFARLTQMLQSLYESKPLYLIPTSALTPSTYLPLLTHLRTSPVHRENSYHITYPSFASLTSKSDTLTLRDVFLKMLMCTRGISGDKALAIQKVWTTPRAFVEAFERCGTERERERLVEGRLGGIVGRGKVKGVLGAKVADVWGKR
ncbi:Crossover junction endonuclease mus81 [Lecanora helva]